MKSNEIPRPEEARLSAHRHLILRNERSECLEGEVAAAQDEGAVSKDEATSHFPGPLEHFPLTWNRHRPAPGPIEVLLRWGPSSRPPTGRYAMGGREGERDGSS